jgi:steroid delta-isomerase-like uncharacterized protein
MKKNLAYLLVLFLVSVLASCRQPEEGNKMESQNKAVVYQAMEAFDNNDMDMLDNLAAPDYVEHQVNTAQTQATGIEAVKEMSQMLHKAIPDMKTTIHAVAAAGDTIMVYSTLTGMLKDTLMGMPPTNEMVSFPGIDMFLVKDGKIAEHWGFADMVVMQQWMMSSKNMSNEKMK